MHCSRRHFLQTAGALAGGLAAGPTLAQGVPLDLARILVGFPAGGLTDAVARRVADGIRGGYARNTLVDNKPGASARLVIDDVVRGPSDGSLMVLSPDVVVTKAQHTSPKTTKYKIEDLVAVSGISRLHHGFAVGPMVPDSVRTMRQFIDWARSNPGKATFGTPGHASVQEFLMQIGMKAHNFELVHVPYKGSAPGVQELLGGQIAAMFSPVGDALPNLKSGRMRVLATSGDVRSRFLPDVPTFEEQGFKGMVQTDWFGIWMKAGTPATVVDRAHAAIKQALGQPGSNELFERFGMELDVMPPQPFGKVMRETFAEWGERVRKTGFKPED